MSKLASSKSGQMNATAADAQAAAAQQQQQAGKHHHHDPQRDTHNQDRQVQKIIHDAALPSLCDVVVEELLGDGRHPERPMVSRLVVVGEVSSKEEPIRGFLEDTAVQAAAQVNAQDPTGGKIGSETVGITGCLVEMPNHFFHLLESEPAHLLQYMRELHKRVVVRKAHEAISAVHVCFYTDDVIQRSFPGHSYIDGSSLPTGQPVEKPALGEAIVQTVHNLLTIGAQLQPLGRNQTEQLLSNAKNTHAQQLPRSTLVEACITSELCMTLEEYLGVFSPTPSATRANEVVHPLEPSLQY